MSELSMDPPAGERLRRFVGDRVRVSLRLAGGRPAGWQARLRTNLGRGALHRHEIIATHAGAHTFAGASWRDVAMRPDGDGWSIELPLTEVGWYRAKPYAIDAEGRQRWPGGEDIGIAVHPDWTRCANTIYCAFPRMFGPNKAKPSTRDSLLEEQIAAFDRHGWTVIPPSGTLRGLTREIPHIVERLGCRILHLLPVTPTPTTHARMGRYGSPYAAQDLVLIDPALIEFDKRTTGVDQFRELTAAAHRAGARVFLDVAINHTGWASRLLELHPEWFRRAADGSFVSPGAWGVIWGDLVELKHEDIALWDALAEALLTWCERGVDGFRCDAGYMVPTPVWRYITARVHSEFPECVFLLEGLGGPWEATAELLTEGGMQWAYSELFQNYDGQQVSAYLDHALRHGGRIGTLVHYSETHDNDRLAKRGRAWSLLRNRLCALASDAGAFGFSAGVEWLAAEKLDVHEARGLNWGAEPNIVSELARLNRVISDHPCFYAGASIRRLSPDGSPVLALRRDAPEDCGSRESVLVLVNLDLERKQSLRFTQAQLRELGSPAIDLLGQETPAFIPQPEGDLVVTLPPGAAYCLAEHATPQGLSGEAYRTARAQAALALQAVVQAIPDEDCGPAPWQELASRFAIDPVRFLAALSRLDRKQARANLLAAIDAASGIADLPPVTVIAAHDASRRVPIPPGHWLLVCDEAPFALTHRRGSRVTRRTRAVAVQRGFVAVLPPSDQPGDAELIVDRSAAEGAAQRIQVRHLALPPLLAGPHLPDGLVLLTNGRGAMTRLHADLGRIASKYDCLLGANLHPEAPCDRWVCVKRLRAWINADGFLTPLHAGNLAELQPGPPAQWEFVANAGDGRTVTVRLLVELLPERNAVVLRWQRPSGVLRWGRPLPPEAAVSITVRLDVEDRSFHAETRRNAEAEAWFEGTVQHDERGFHCRFARDRQLRAFLDRGRFHRESEWSHCPHPIEGERGMYDRGDAWSPGWFEIPLKPGAEATLVVHADDEDPPAELVDGCFSARRERLADQVARANLPGHDELGRALAAALQAFVVRRGHGKTVIAGYPWFLDWGRDTCIVGRGLLAAGLDDEVRGILCAFGRFIRRGTMPNLLHGEDASNRDTSDAPLWYALLASEWVARRPQPGWDLSVAPQRSLADCLVEIAVGWLDGTDNGIRVDHGSGLAWSPPHFTWMDTDHPACTPRAGYPIEIQALWIRLLEQLAAIGAPAPRGPWREWAARARDAFARLFWLEREGWFADCLLAPAGETADHAVPDRSLRPNQYFAIALGCADGERARRACAAGERWLLIPGALRTLAPLPVEPPLVIRGADGRLLGDPLRPYRGRYLGDEDSSRKPAYHNGTAWPWLLPSYCEAVALAWNRAPAALHAARSWLASISSLLTHGCYGQVPELLDGDAPHQPRGCDAQAWSVSEALRVWRWLWR
ncbi:MAG: amylo-alpha-1,6-glucosidase [Planctomycetota bacterium]|nr:glycogen debranching enzyme N-terminal domain-containing protein [Planctomycetota bacterium]MCX8039480.1 glycogen debranching enzyme N-terminal domain-containing protein [Planctomycetota bacterium]MDW8373598.1 amylo-alpha-1,6-glucosidase [Planctomycetota bacterium]